MEGCSEKEEMSLRCPIPSDVRERLAADPFMSRCCLADDSCEGRTEWDHHLKFAGKRMNEPWGILPLCSSHHRREAQFRGSLDVIMVSRATEEELRPFCKATDYITIKRLYADNA